MKFDFKNNILLVLQHKMFSYAVVFGLTFLVLHYGYYKYIKQSYEKVVLIQKNMEAIQKNELEKEVQQLQEKLKEKSEKYESITKEIEDKNSEIFTRKYDVVLVIMNKINEFAFNIYKFNLNPSYDEIILELNGSYLNVIRFFDYIQTIKANVEIASYSIKLKDEKMLISLKLKIGELKL
jgi:Na+/phosphate symporter